MEKNDQLRTPRNNGPANEPVIGSSKIRKSENKSKQEAKDKK